MVWGDKPYYSLNYYLKNLYGEKVYKISLDGGFTCPNRDGYIDTRGCIFCSEGGSGDFASSRKLSITEQINYGKQKLSCHKKIGNKFIAYFQAYTNTYAPIKRLRQVFTEAINHPDIVGISIATRPDCLNGEIISLLEELNKIKKVWLELGLQTIHERSAQFIRRGYTLDSFEKAVDSLNSANIDIVVHLILGLPFETEKEILETIDYIATKEIQGVKLQLLHVLKNTDLAIHFLNNQFEVLSQEAYIDIIIKCIERLPKNIVIHRVTGDGPKDILIAPLWSSNKKMVLNHLHKEFKLRNTWQGTK